MTAAPRLKLALFGLGRLGAIRARILISQQPRVELVAVCDTKPGTDKWAHENLPASVKYFSDPQECMKNSGAQAILISTATATHAPLILQAFDLGLHVMCEKPISTDLIATAEVIEKSAANPHLKFLVPFSRRYDASYNNVKKMADNGDLGHVHAMETFSLDQQDPTGFFVSFSEQSGGVFLDMGVHDIDIGRYFLDPKKGISNPKKQVNRVIAMGQQAVYGDLAKYGDCDNGWGMVEFANGNILTSHLGRTLTNGYEASARICGTKAHAVVNPISTIDRVEVRDKHGVRTATTPDAFTLYDVTFINDIREFADAVLDDKPLTCDAEGAYEAAKICWALQHSFRIGAPVYFGDDGLPIVEAKANGGP